jgi:hypothetical protein
VANRFLITIGFSSHRLEVLPVIQAEMSRHDALVMEEAPEEDFAPFLAGKISAAAYLEDKDVEFPEFGRRQLEMVKDWHDQGKAILQVEPYQQRLIRIHELLAAGHPRTEVENRPEFKEIYAAESSASRTLLRFYAAAHTVSFARVVETVKEFAREDARRFRLRDTLRAQALAPLSQKFPRLYVEAGYIHLFLIKALRKLVSGQVRVRPKFVLASRSLAALGRPRPLGPGDLLTLHYIFAAPLSPEKEALLAARSLIHIQLLQKGEMAPGADPAPHLTDEIQACRLSRGLSFEDCARLYPRVRTAPPDEAVAVVSRYLSLISLSPSGGRGPG